jgi:Kef-type K+ transport system membrane component KefB
MDFGPLALVVAAGLLGPMLASVNHFGPPIVVGQLVAGVVIGRSGFGWIDQSDSLLNGLANVGFALLMFVVGTHLPIREARLRTTLVPGMAVAATVTALAVAAGFVLAPQVGLDRPGVLAVLLATSSGAVALPVLQGLGQPDRAALVTTAWIASADILTVILVPMVLATGRTWRVVAGGGVVVVTGALLYALARTFQARPIVQRARALSHQRGWGLDLRVSLLALFTCAWLAERYGSSILIAGFTVGVVVAVLGEPRRVADQLIGVGEGFAIPLFFVHLGAQLDLGALVRSSDAMVLAGLLAVVAIAIHVGAGALWRLPVGAGLLASAQLGVPAAVSSIGLSTNQLSAAQAAAIMASVLVTLAACALGSALLGHRGPLANGGAAPT